MLCPGSDIVEIHMNYVPTKCALYGRVRLRMIINDYQSCTTANHTKLQL